MIKKKKYLIYTDGYVDFNRRPEDERIHLEGIMDCCFHNLPRNYIEKAVKDYVELSLEHQDERIAVLEELFVFLSNDHFYEKHDCKDAFKVLEEINKQRGFPLEQSPLYKLRTYVRNTEFHKVLNVLKRHDGGWFDDRGNFTRKGRGKGQDNFAACASLLFILLQKGILDPSTLPEKIKSNALPDRLNVQLIKTIFGYDVSEQTVSKIKTRQVFKTLLEAFKTY